MSKTSHSPAAFFRSVVRYLQVSYPDGVPGPDRIPLLELLRSTPLSEDEIEDAVDVIDEIEEDESRDVIAEFIADMSQAASTPEGIARVAAKLAAAGWPLAGISGFVHADDSESESESESAPNGVVTSSQA